ncbi:MAG: efflux RND transporter periplasmic adaptor subunit [Candidatus Colwellbacteria bacterium]|nr:efflux RND transporter periplasmic adaptor subunit [Candidatus Colwellbacteria bacterium]
MRKLIQKILSNKKKAVVIAIISVVLIGGGIALFMPKAAVYESAVAERSDLMREVNVTGKVKAAQNVSLAFERSGRLAIVKVSPGSRVYSGDLLMRLDVSDLSAQLAGAQANLRSEEARQAEIVRGSRPEEMRIQEIKVSSAMTDVSEAERGLLDAVRDSYTHADDALRNKTNDLFLNPSSDPHIKFKIDSTSETIAIESSRKDLESQMAAWNSSLSTLSSSNFIGVSDTSGKTLDSLKSFLDRLALSVNSLTLNSGFTQTTIDGWRSSLSLARTAINSSKASLVAAEDKYKSAITSYDLANEQFSLMKQGASSEELDAEDAKVASARASVDGIIAQMGKSEIRSPINGLIGSEEGKVGEIISAGVPVVSVISDKKFQMEANIPEADIAKIAVGNTAKVTLDAYGKDVVFEAKIISINPGETVIDGVVTYKTVFEFAVDDERIKSGMTADVDIQAGRKDGVLAIPQRAIITEGDIKKVCILKDGRESEVIITVGFKGSAGLIEVVSGLNEGDVVITSLKK